MPQAAPGVLFTSTAGRTSVEISLDHARDPLSEEELLARFVNHERPARLTCQSVSTETGVTLYIEVSAASTDGISFAVEAISRSASRLGAAMDAALSVCVKRLRPCTRVDRLIVSAVEEKLRTNGYETHEAVLYESLLHEPQQDFERAFAIGTGGDDEVVSLVRSTLISPVQTQRAARGAG